MVDVSLRSEVSLRNAPCMPVLSVTDIDRARTFYTEQLGIPADDAGPGALRLQCGDGTGLFLYQRDEAPQATNTVAGFHVRDLLGTVENLRKTGVDFEEFDLPDLKTNNGIATLPDGTTCAWFKDPDGNILAIDQTA